MVHYSSSVKDLSTDQLF